MDIREREDLHKRLGLERTEVSETSVKGVRYMVMEGD